MANIQIGDIDEAVRPAVKFINEFGGFGGDYNAVLNTKYKNDLFLYDLSRFIDRKQYKNIITTLKDEYANVGVTFQKVEGVISDDERLVRRALKSFGFVDDNFYNPTFDKDELVQWRNELFKIKTGFMDMGTNLYSLQSLKDGVEVGGRLREDELKEPTALQQVLYYKERGMLDVHLFNKMMSFDSNFAISKAEIKRHRYSATQGAVELFYDGKNIFGDMLDDKMQLIGGEWKGQTDDYWINIIKEVYEDGNFFYKLQQSSSEHKNIKGVVEPLKLQYGLKEKLDFIEALKGIDTESNNEKIREVANIAQKGFINMNSHYNVLAMLSHDTKAPIRLPNAKISNEDILAVEKLAVRKLINDELGKKIQQDIDSIIASIKISTLESETKQNLLGNQTFSSKLNKQPLHEKELGELYGSAHWLLKNKEPDIYLEISNLYDNATEYIMERDVLLIQRPDLEPLIRDARLFIDSRQTDQIIFRGGRSDSYEYHAIENNAQSLVDGNWASLPIADNGYRKEIYLFPTEEHPGGANFSYCEGDLTLVVPKDKADFDARLLSGIQFYLEDNGNLTADANPEEFNQACHELMDSFVASSQLKEQSGLFNKKEANLFDKNKEEPAINSIKI
jgi:hypothetical protein